MAHRNPKDSTEPAGGSGIHHVSVYIDCVDKRDDKVECLVFREEKRR
jgi:hypothetical protein